MTAVEVLERWARYSRYDPEQKRFNLLNGEYEMHRCGDAISRLSTYDPSGALGVLYARDVCRRQMEGTKVRLLDVVSSPERFRESVEMWAVFESADMRAIEDGLLEAMEGIVRQVEGQHKIGERDTEAEKAAVCRSVTAVVEELDKCQMDLYLRGGEISPIRRFSTHIHVFSRLADCLLALEQAADGLYLCYIDNNGSADGYFGFFLKSNGNILSVNERVDEAFPGQHRVSRNGRWSDEKKYRLFPYDYMFSFEGHDYKGYASRHLIDHDKLAFSKLGPDAYMPLVLAMVMLCNRYIGTSTETLPLKYTNALLSVNEPMLEASGNSLAVIHNSLAAAGHRSLHICPTSEEVVSGALSVRYNSAPDKPYRECGYFPTKENIFAQLYGDGFHLDTGKLLSLTAGVNKCLPSADASEPAVEFVGTEQRLGMAAYTQARAQFAEHIRDRMFAEYNAFGGVDAVKKWWADAVRASRETIIRLCVEKYVKAEVGLEKNVSDPNWQDASGNSLSYISFAVDGNGGKFHTYEDFLLNEPHGYRGYHGRYLDGKWWCCINRRYIANVLFSFDFQNWAQMSDVVGEESIPKIVRGWERRRAGGGNPLLEATDAVEYIGTPFESHEVLVNRRLWTEDKWRDYYWRMDGRTDNWSELAGKAPALPHSSRYDFSFVIGFSKRELKKLAAEYRTKQP